MKFKNKWGKIIVILVVAVLVLSTVSFAAINNSKKDSGNTISDDVKVQTENNNQQNVLSQEKMIELYNKGYGVRDIEKAAELSPVYGISIDEILEMKGPINYKYNTNSTNTPENSAIEDTSKNWDDVVVDLEINKAAKEGKINSDYKVSDIKKQLEDLRKNPRKPKVKELEESQNQLKKSLVKKYDILDSEINMCKEAGLTEIVEISYAKKVALENNVELEKVLELKKEKSSWIDVVKSLGGEKDEK
jgi:hypothetical protein